MYKFPIKLPSGLNLVVTQPFHVTASVPFSQARAIQTVDHLGVDIVCGTNQQTWGQECVWPFPWPGTVYDAEVDSELNAKLHAHSQIDTVDPATGIKYSIVYLHLSSVTKTKTDSDHTLITYNQGDVIGKIGNNGEVEPPPTPQNPLQGSHLHLGLGIQHPGELNATMVDPQAYFDVTDPFRNAPNTDLPETIKSEVGVLNGTTDPIVRQGFVQLIISQIRALLGF